MRFYLTVAAVYGAMHFLVYFQTCRAFDPSTPIRWVLAIFLAAMAGLPFMLALGGERTGPFSFITFSWMGFLFYLFLGSILVGMASPWLSQTARAWTFAGVVAVCLVVCLYGLKNATDIQVVRVNLQTDKLPQGVDRVRLAVVSDLHLYSVEEGKRLDRVLPVLAGLDYDVLVSLGDLIEAGAHLGDWPVSAARLAALHPPLGKFAVDGNHEAYANFMAGEELSAKFLRQAGFTLLRGDVADVGGVFWLAGLDYKGQVWAGAAKSDGEAQVLARVRDDRPVVVLKHLPTVDPQALGHFDLQLSGHTHAGQIWPFTLLVRMIFPYMQGLYDLGQGSKLYVNVGTGTWGPPLRVGSHPEITLITLERSPTQPAK